MKKTITVLAVLLTVGVASANTITVTDGTGNIYTGANGLVIDFDSSLNPATAPWTPILENGLTYSVDSVSLRDANSVAGTTYLGVYTGISGSVLTGFLGASANSVDFSTSTDGNFVAWSFSGINVTVDNVAGSGSGLLYFGFQSSQSDSGNALLTCPSHRIDGFGSYSLANYGNSVIHFINGGVISTRALEMQATVTPVPEPSALALAGLSGVACLLARRRQKK